MWILHYKSRVHLISFQQWVNFWTLSKSPEIRNFNFHFYVELLFLVHSIFYAYFAITFLTLILSYILIHLFSQIVNLLRTVTESTLWFLVHRKRPNTKDELFLFICLFFFLFCRCFQTRFPYVVQAGLEVAIHPPQPFWCWNYRCTPPLPSCWASFKTALPYYPLIHSLLGRDKAIVFCHFLYTVYCKQDILAYTVDFLVQS